MLPRLHVCQSAQVVLKILCAHGRACLAVGRGDANRTRLAIVLPHSNFLNRVPTAEFRLPWGGGLPIVRGWQSFSHTDPPKVSVPTVELVLPWGVGGANLVVASRNSHTFDNIVSVPTVELVLLWGWGLPMATLVATRPRLCGICARAHC